MYVVVVIVAVSTATVVVFLVIVGKLYKTGKVDDDFHMEFIYYYTNTFLKCIARTLNMQ